MVFRMKNIVREREDSLIKDARGFGSYGNEGEGNKSFQKERETASYAVTDGTKYCLTHFTEAQATARKHVRQRLQDFSARE